MLKYWTPARNSSKKDRDGDSKKEAQTKLGSEVPKSQRTGWSVTTVNQPPGELGKIESDLRPDKALVNAQLDHLADPGMGRSPPLRGEMWNSRVQQWSLLLYWQKETHANVFQRLMSKTVPTESTEIQLS